VREKGVDATVTGLLGATVQLRGVGANRHVRLDILVAESGDADAAHQIVARAQSSNRVTADHCRNYGSGRGAARGCAAAGKESLDAPAHLQGNSGL